MLESDEYLDVLDDSGLPTGQTKRRAEVHADGDWHRSFHLWIVKEQRFVLMQRRSAGKDLEPGRIDVSVGGHFSAGETLLDVLREAEEELGLQLRPKDIEYLLTQQVERRYETATDREFQDVYLLHCDQALSDYMLNCDEVMVLYEVPLERAIALYEHGDHVAVSGFDCQQRNNHALLVLEDVISQARQDTLKALRVIRSKL